MRGQGKKVKSVARIIPPKPAGEGGLALAHGTRVEIDGDELHHILGIDIRIHPGELVTAELTIGTAFEEIWAHPVLSEESMLAAAKYWGYEVSKTDVG